MSEFIVRLFGPLWSGLFPSAGQRREPLGRSPIPVDLRFEVDRPVVVFVESCLVEPDGAHRALLQPCVRAEFERWERVRQWRRRQRRRALWLGAYGAEAA
ncbi:hypothetical protein [Streptomyces corynorhini]|uniref:Uncharacterized protein n=1 Tax=Streptomyces corynorhini TaxID=2282652 RepID=A0A370B6W4_9ACTN|nr:hypothetical protein [Streptomyces corynorhini]RDG37567.1 hypothetical protein DVH02_13710 [Streptomyces corynorhini]